MHHGLERKTSVMERRLYRVEREYRIVPQGLTPPEVEGESTEIYLGQDYVESDGLKGAGSRKGMGSEN